MGVTYDQPVIDGICSRLRVLVQDAFQRHLYGSAIFFADKLVSLRAEQEEIYTLAECYFKNREYRRVLHLLKKYGEATEQSHRLKLLVAQSLMECRDWEECLRYLEGHWPDDQGASDPKTASCFALLRGKVYEAMENLENALMWYQRAVQLDSYCHEALDRLVGSQLLTLEQEISLLKGLALHPEDEWLRHLYAAKLSANRGSNENPLEDSCADGQSVAGTPAVLGDWKRARRRSLRRGSVPAEGYPAELLPSALVENGHARAAQSTRFFCQGDYESCFLVSKQVLEDDPYHLAALPVHISSLVMLNMTNVVFYVAHQLMNAYPTAAVAWFTAGCYYYMIRKYELARRFLHKALSLDSAFAPAWIAFGHAFASHDESDQALAAYRTASRLFPGSQLPWLFIGMEYVRTNSLPLAQQCLEFARSLMPTDPHVYNELGVVAYHKHSYEEACELLQRAISLSSDPEEALHVNLGHALLQCGLHARALEAFRAGLRLQPQSRGALSGVAFALQLQGKLDEAIEYYHRALRSDCNDAFCSEMLNYAVHEALEQSSNFDRFA